MRTSGMLTNPLLVRRVVKEVLGASKRCVLDRQTSSRAGGRVLSAGASCPDAAVLDGVLTQTDGRSAFTRRARLSASVGAPSFFV